MCSDTQEEKFVSINCNDNFLMQIKIFWIYICFMLKRTLKKLKLLII